MRRREQQQRNLAGRTFVLEQLRTLDLAVTISGFQEQIELPAATYHFENHGRALGCDTEAAYWERFIQAIGRRYTEYYVVRQSTQRPRLMWYAIDKASGKVLQFSQHSGEVHSFYLSANWMMLIESTQAVRVWLDGETWRIEE